MAVILDMEMPKGKCWWHDENGKEHECKLFPCGVSCFDSYFREKSCIIIGEIPDEHGRLKDESVIIEKINELLKKRSWAFAANVQEIIDIIKNVPTIVEAST